MTALHCELRLFMACALITSPPPLPVYMVWNFRLYLSFCPSEALFEDPGVSTLYLS